MHIYFMVFDSYLLSDCIDYIIFMNLVVSNKWVWGFSVEAELWNGRLAMLAFVLIVLIEFFYSCSILDLLEIFKL
uniref:hypothetical protein n=1 Tax=Catenella fusiformis TaxID=3024791 RepID=UPI0027DA910D|nr:hypothetical protein REQ04_pgp004 [Catenella fusiformis]WCH57623.1 hypothetical protein [Catenella fusiformis]